MVFNLKTIINWKDISERKQAQVDKDNLRENKKQIDYDYQIGSPVYVTIDGIKRKLDAPKTGPFPMTEVFTNGTAQIQKGHVNERINIHQLELNFLRQMLTRSPLLAVTSQFGGRLPPTSYRL